MALPAIKLELESSVEERVIRLESDVRHIQADVSEIKNDLRKLADTVADVKESIGALRLEMKDAISSLNMSRMKDRIGWLLMQAVVLGVMARGFKWL